MPLNEMKIITIIKEEVHKVGDFVPGYKNDLITTIAEIVSDERQNRVVGTRIQQKVTDKIDAMGRIVADKMKN